MPAVMAIGHPWHIGAQNYVMRRPQERVPPNISKVALINEMMIVKGAIVRLPQTKPSPRWI
jgi:hypothetical protein